MEFWTELGSNPERVGLVAVVLVLAGFLYNEWVEYLESKRYTEGYLAFVVALGVVMTLVGVAFLLWQAALIALGAFICTGMPMIVGSVIRHVRRREEEQRAEREEAAK